MPDIDTSPEALRALAEAATRGPWKVAVTRHPYSMVRYDGSALKGEHVEHHIVTVLHHPQSKAPAPIVTISVGVGLDDGPPVTFVYIRPEDAAYLAAVSPEVVLGLLDTIAAEKGAAGGHADPNLPPGEYGVTVDTVGGAATVNAGAAAGDRSAWLAGYRACADTVQSYRAHYDWGPKATAQDGADLATQSIKDVVTRSLAREEGASVQTSEQSGNSGDIPADQDALIRTLRANLAGAEQERDALRDAVAHANHCQRMTRDEANKAQTERDAACRALSARFDAVDGNWSQAAAEAARAILCLLGWGQSPSMEPGSDDRRDRVAKIVEAAMSAAIARAEKAEAERDAEKTIAATLRKHLEGAQKVHCVLADQINRLECNLAGAQEAEHPPCDPADTPAPQPADDGWTAWEGGECPVSPETLVDVRRGYRLAAGCLCWDHRGTLGDIVAYRIAGARDG